MLHDRKEFTVNATIEECIARLERQHQGARVIATPQSMRNLVKIAQTDFGDVDFEIKRVPSQRLALPIANCRAYGKLQRLTDRQTLVTLNVDLYTVGLVGFTLVMLAFALGGIIASLSVGMVAVVWAAVALLVFAANAINAMSHRNRLLQTVNEVFERDVLERESDLAPVV